jgi:hypothetical protein
MTSEKIFTEKPIWVIAFRASLVYDVKVEV